MLELSIKFNGMVDGVKFLDSVVNDNLDNGELERLLCEYIKIWVRQINN